MIDGGGQDKVVFRDAPGIVSPGLDVDPPPREVQVRMVAQAFGRRARAVDEGESGDEVGEAESLAQMVIVDYPPFGKGCGPSSKIVAGQPGSRAHDDQFYLNRAATVRERWLN